VDIKLKGGMVVTLLSGLISFNGVQTKSISNIIYLIN